MDWSQVWTIIGINLAIFGALATLIIWTVNKLDTDIKGVGSQLSTLSNRMDGHAMRIDQLYKMFVDLLKEGKK